MLLQERYENEMRCGDEDIHEEVSLGAEVEKLRLQMAIGDQGGRGNQKRVASEEEGRARVGRDAEKRREGVKIERLDKMIAKAPPTNEETESGKDSETGEQLDTVDGLGGIGVDDDGSGGRASPSPGPYILASNPPPSQCDDSESIRSSPPRSRTRPLPPVPRLSLTRAHPERAEHDPEERYDEQGSYDGCCILHPSVGGCSTPRYEGYEDRESRDDRHLVMATRRPMDDESEYDRRLSLDRRPGYSQLSRPCPDYGPRATVSPSDILRGLGLQQPDLVPSVRGGNVNVQVGGGGDICAESRFSNVGNTTVTTYIIIGAPL